MNSGSSCSSIGNPKTAAVGLINEQAAARFNLKAGLAVAGGTDHIVAEISGRRDQFTYMYVASSNASSAGPQWAADCARADPLWLVPLSGLSVCERRRRSAFRWRRVNSVSNTESAA